MEDQKQHVVDTLKQATNILVTVKTNPNLDQLSACIALTLLLNGLGKHATAVFSGEVPSVLEFLEPQKTIQTNTDSLQDFIISLDKAKADKLRYKVEDTVVKIFITPYRTSLTEKDLEFGQGDFNVDVVVALGVHSQDDIDQAITAHGRILHDATVVSINTEPGVAEDLGSINWINGDVSSLSELIANTSDDMLEGKTELFDNQIATALLTGIVAETERFGNAKTKPATMQTAAKLLQAGANQELVANKLAAPQPAHVAAQPEAENLPNDKPDDRAGDPPAPEAPSSDTPAGDHTNDDGSLSISHQGQPTEPEADAVIKDVHDSQISQAPEISSPLAAAADPQDAPLQSYDMNQISVPASIPTAPSEAPQGIIPPVEPPPMDTPSVGTDQSAEEQAVLDMLKQNQAIDQERLTIQPLRDQNGFLGEPPLHEKKINPTGTNGKPVDDSLDPTKFAVTPPSMGGTLTAAHESAHLEPSGDPLTATAQPEPQATLRHDAPVLTPSVATDQGEVPPVVDAGEPADTSGKTLAELEVEMHSPHASQPAAASDSGPGSQAAHDALQAALAVHDAEGPQAAVANAQHLDQPAGGSLDMPLPVMPPPMPDYATAGSVPPVTKPDQAPPPAPPPFPSPAS